ncbi:hypothetical protein G6F22_020587 [Rhizopus arrhizus]|nr:hypothetical protein G6F22_020587 [Rhizopus arrhizus]
MAGPLSEIKIVDLTSVVMGPYATQIFGDMGADVIKVESPDGDIMRHMGKPDAGPAQTRGACSAAARSGDGRCVCPRDAPGRH